MTKFSKTYTGDGGRSNARRAARAAGVDPELVTAHGDGFRFPLPGTVAKAAPADYAEQFPLPAAKTKPAPAPFVPDFRFGSHVGAANAAASQAKRLGLKREAFVVITSEIAGVPKFAIAPAGQAEGYTISTGDNPRPWQAPAETTKPKASKGKQRAKHDSQAPSGENKVEQIRRMLCDPRGATMPEITKATGWLEHTARARISGIAKAHNLVIARERLLGITTYRATPKAA